MLFNSIAFAFFLPIVFAIYWVAKGKRSIQNVILLLSSYVFYGWWDYRFLFLLGFSTLLDYYSGLKVQHARNASTKKTWLMLSVLINVGLLGFFKYYNFFIHSFGTLLNSAGVQTNLWTLNIILPVGISFYTFHGLSYVFDIYNGKAKPTDNFIDYSLFVSFFPLLVAGPIERATHLLPQVQEDRRFNYEKIADGLRQILWGLFKKIVIADRCAEIVNLIFNHPENYHGSTLFYGAVLFSFQIYCDFSGYSDIALGTARLFGFDLIRNFSYPYFSRNIAEFWRRWHISLSTWFRDYLYIPMGGNRGAKWKRIRNTLVLFIISGFWHGANWTFIFWGLFNGLLFLPLLLTGQNKKYAEVVAKGKYLPSWKEGLMMLGTFLCVTLGWVFFRSETLGKAFSYLGQISSMSFFSAPQLFSNTLFKFLLVLIIVEWLQREQEHGLQIRKIRYTTVRWAIYIVLLYFICSFPGEQQGFIYFQF